ncbi:MAG: class I SAM-dependent methyltransferase [Bacteroidota bacterium]
MHTFKDNFSQQSDLYVKYRPHYPQGLYAYLASLTLHRELAWDCGTGNGQAATGLATFYKRVLATDPSRQQIANCLSCENVHYAIERSENCSLPSDSADLITIANALHWFDFEKFFKEAKRVLKKNGVIAAWAYGPPRISKEVDQVTAHFHNIVLNDYWRPENRLVEQEYRTIPFPFELITSPVFFSEKEMRLEDFIGFLNTWSATQRFINENNYNPIDEILPALTNAWNNDHTKNARWHLVLKTGRLP